MLGQKLIRTQEPNISFSFKVIVELSIFDKFVFLELLFFTKN
ncbi:peptide deformylase [Rickettsia rhipicephali]|nr:peptide deformylase [Rickettsia rhipicephali]MCX4080497.1 peptide deformylase [Rickettsia rhipicephali]